MFSHIIRYLAVAALIALPLFAEAPLDPEASAFVATDTTTTTSGQGTGFTGGGITGGTNPVGGPDAGPGDTGSPGTIPEPSTYLLMVTALGLVLLLSRKKSVG